MTRKLLTLRHFRYEEVDATLGKESIVRNNVTEMEQRCKYKYTRAIFFFLFLKYHDAYRTVVKGTLYKSYNVETVKARHHVDSTITVYRIKAESIREVV